jgi:RecB family exonuclease
MWAADRLELIEDLKAWLANERQDAEALQLSEGAYELQFGWGRDDSETNRGLSSDDPLEISLNGVRLMISGRVDRLNWDPERTRFRVIDYKTGRPYNVPKAGSLSGGRALQLPIYTLAAARVLGMRPTHGDAEYHYSTRAGAFKRARFSASDFTDRHADLKTALEQIMAGMDAGFYPMAVEKQSECKYCVANLLCPSSRMRIIDRKKNDPARRGFDRMRELE